MDPSSRTVTEEEMDLLNRMASDDVSRSNTNKLARAQQIFRMYADSHDSDKHSIVFTHLKAIFGCSKDLQGEERHVISMDADAVKWGRIDFGRKY